MLKRKHHYQCTVCMNYLMKDLGKHSIDLSENDLELLNLFHKITDPIIRKNIIMLLRNIR